MDAEPFQLARHFEALGLLHAAAETVVHIHLHHHAQIVAGGFQHPRDHAAHQPHPVVERAAVFIAAMIGIGRQELADEIAVPRVDFDAVETGFPRQVHGAAEILHQFIDLRHFQPAHERRRIEIEAAGSAHRHAAARGAVRHIAAVAELDGALGAGRVDRIGDPLEPRHDFRAHPELAVEREAAAVHRGIGERGHPHPAPRHGHVVVVQVLGRAVAIRHILKSGRADHPVA